ncbi:MAG: response regulator [Verrucomicrobia bacterium]|nr:response regulator [Verrucomicrobiota bacterium]
MSLPAPKPSVRSPTPGRKWRILYAEDVRELREVARLALTLDGHSIECALDGKLALERVTGAPDAFDLIITDHHMPNMNGLEFVEQLRAMRWPGKIIVFSSELKSEVEKAYVAHCVDRVLPKPIFPSELRRVLAEL